MQGTCFRVSRTAPSNPTATNGQSAAMGEQAEADAKPELEIFAGRYSYRPCASAIGQAGMTIRFIFAPAGIPKRKHSGLWCAPFLARSWKVRVLIPQCRPALLRRLDDYLESGP